MANYCSKCGKPIQPEASFCISCGSSLTGKQPAKINWENKRAKVVGNQSERKFPSKGAFIAALALAAFGWVYFNVPEKGNPIIKASPVSTAASAYPQSGTQMSDIGVTVENGKIIVPLDLVVSQKFVAFRYRTSQSDVPLLAYVSGEGKIVTAVSMCEPCNSTRFHIKGDKMICNTCGSTWELNSLESVSGSCGKYPPDALPSTIVGKEIQIDEALVAGWQRRI